MLELRDVVKHYPSSAAVLAMAAALIGLIWQRRPRLARLKVDGFADAEVRRALIVEALVLVGGGALLGAVLGSTARCCSTAR